MSALPVYQVEFIPFERRLGDRRIVSGASALPPPVNADRRQNHGDGRRSEDRLSATRLQRR